MQVVNVFQQVVTACGDHTSDFALYALNGEPGAGLLLPEVVNPYNEITRHDSLPADSVHFISNDGNDVLLHALQNILVNNAAVRIPKRSWLSYAELALQYHASNEVNYKNIAAAMLLILANSKAVTITAVLNGPPLAVVAEPLQPDIFLTNYLNSSRVSDAIVDAAGQYFTDLYQRIPVILRFSGLNPCLEGFCCFNNVVAVREDIADHHQDSPTLRVHFANLVGHEVQHGILRRFFNRMIMNESTPLEMNLLIQESGERHERNVWHGQLPRWRAPLFPAAATALAQRIVDAFVNQPPHLNHPPFPPFTLEEVLLYVGVRVSQTFNPELGYDGAPGTAVYAPMRYTSSDAFM